MDPAGALEPGEESGPHRSMGGRIRTFLTRLAQPAKASDVAWPIGVALFALWVGRAIQQAIGIDGAAGLLLQIVATALLYVDLLALLYLSHRWTPGEPKTDELFRGDG